MENTSSSIVPPPFVFGRPPGEQFPPPRPPAPPTNAPPPSPPRPYCTVCCEKDVHLIRACRICQAWYCRDCLVDMFETAITTPSRFPPRCCSVIQLYTVLPQLASEKAALYRQKLEEWLTADKTYCPSKTCSAFIPQRSMPPAKKPKPAQPTLHETLSLIFQQVNASSCARFFRSDVDMTVLPGFTARVANPINLGDIERNINSNSYASTADLASDIVLIYNNSRHYHGDEHPVTRTAGELFSVFITTLEKILKDQANSSGLSQPDDLFPCPSCHIAICTSCKQIEHRGKPCDTSANSYEVALLQQFGYKQCPRCHQGIRRMYGCSHMQCICGAHFCWWCLKSLDECIGDCDPAGDRDDEDDDVDEDEDGELDDDEADENEDEDSGFVDATQATTQPSTNVALAASTGNDSRPAQQISPVAPRNLDGGGYRVWGETEHDFGEEPEEEPLAQVWSCHHGWMPFFSPQDSLDHGNLDFLECNECFKPLKPSTRRKDMMSRRQLKGGAISKEDDEAWDCCHCRLIVCMDCKIKRQAAVRGDDDMGGVSL